MKKTLFILPFLITQVYCLSEAESKKSELARIARPLIMDDRSNEEVVIDILHYFPTAVRAPLIGLVSAPETRVIMDNRGNAYDVLNALRQIPAAERLPIIQLALAPETRLIMDNRWNASLVLNILHYIPTGVRVALIRLALAPETRLIDDDLENVDDVLYILRRIPAAERYQRIARALLFQRGVAVMNRDRFRSIIEHKLTDHIPAEGADMVAMAAAIANPYAAGVNVHDGARDLKTAKAYQKLWAVTGNATVDGDYAAFMMYLESLPEWDLKTNAKKTLGMIPCGGFSPLTGVVTSNGLDTTAREVIARLWQYASTGSDADQLAKKTGVVAGLAKAIEDDGHLVCNPGKLQRLAVSVLQGHLRGVNIDGIDLPDHLREEAVAEAAGGVVPVEVVPVEPAAPAAPAEAAGVAGVAGVAAAAPVIPMITNHHEIQSWLQLFYRSFLQRVDLATITAEVLFKDAMMYVYKLRQGLVPGTDNRRIYLDMREVMYLLIKGSGNPGEVAPFAHLIGFETADYDAQFGARDAAWRAEAEAAAAAGLPAVED